MKKINIGDLREYEDRGHQLLFNIVRSVDDLCPILSENFESFTVFEIESPRGNLVSISMKNE